MSYVNEGMLSEVGILGNREYEDSPDSFIQISQASGEGLKLYVCFAIKRSIELDCSLFHLGGGTTNDLEDSLFKYKQNFSKTLKSFEVGFRVHNERIYNLITQTWDYENDNSNNRFLRFKE